MKVLVTGGAGFIGHHIIEHILKNTDWTIISLDRLDTSGNLNRLVDIEVWEVMSRRVTIVYHDLKSPIGEFVKEKIGDVDYILHLAASSHVDRSITDPMSFVMDNVVGTCNLLLFAKELESLKKMIYFGTDEVFGPAPTGVNYKEWDRFKPGNPYAASKCGAEDLCVSFHNTYDLKVMIVHVMNVFGERQLSEKFLPSCINKIKKGESITIHSDSTMTIPGSRYYIHARNVASAILFLLDKGEIGEKYNIVGEREVNNLELVEDIAEYMNKSCKYKMVDFHSSRPGHDLRYALDGRKMREMGWKIESNFYKSLEKTVHWYLDNPNWL